MTIVLIALILALVVYGLERNHSRQPQPQQRLAGMADFDNRDSSRVHPVIT
jgi:hypothetical protein